MDLFADERPSASPLVDCIWHSYNEITKPFISMADTSWGIVITKQEGKTTVTLRGTESQASAAESPANAEFMGIQFKAGTFMPNFPVQSLMDRNDLNLPETLVPALLEFFAA